MERQMARTALIQQFAALGWHDTAAADLADIHITLQRRRADEQAAREIDHRLAERAALLTPIAPVATSAPPDTLPAAQQPPRLPLLRLLALALVTGLLALSVAGCGGGGTETPDEDAAGADVRTPRVHCTAEPTRCI